MLVGAKKFGTTAGFGPGRANAGLARSRTTIEGPRPAITAFGNAFARGAAAGTGVAEGAAAAGVAQGAADSADGFADGTGVAEGAADGTGVAEGASPGAADGTGVAEVASSVSDTDESEEDVVLGKFISSRGDRDRDRSLPTYVNAFLIDIEKASTTGLHCDGRIT